MERGGSGRRGRLQGRFGLGGACGVANSLALTHFLSIVLYIVVTLGHSWVLYYAGARPGGFAWNMGRLLLLGILCPLAKSFCSSRDLLSGERSE